MSSKSGIDLRLRVRLTPPEPTLLHETRCFIGSHTQKSATADRAVIFMKVMHKWRICGSISCWPEGGIINSKKCFVQFEGRAGISGWQQYTVRHYGGRYLEAVTQKWENILPPMAQWCSRLFTRSLLIVDIVYIYLVKLPLQNDPHTFFFYLSLLFSRFSLNTRLMFCWRSPFGAPTVMILIEDRFYNRRPLPASFFPPSLLMDLHGNLFKMNI